MAYIDPVRPGTVYLTDGSTTADKLNYLIDTKNTIKQALIEKGVQVSDTDSFRSYASKIGEIQAGGSEVSTYTVTINSSLPGSDIQQYMIANPVTGKSYQYMQNVYTNIPSSSITFTTSSPVIRVTNSSGMSSSNMSGGIMVLDTDWSAYCIPKSSNVVINLNTGRDVIK